LADPSIPTVFDLSAEVGQTQLAIIELQITGKLAYGETLTANVGAWSNTPVTMSYQWYRNAVAISGATRSTHLVRHTDVNTTISCIATVVNATQTQSATSNLLTTSIGSAQAPANTVQPVLTGTAVSGNTLSVTDGTWLYNPTNYYYRWYRNNVLIAGASANTYVVTDSEVATLITCIVMAKNAVGYTEITSNAVGPVEEAGTFLTRPDGVFLTRLDGTFLLRAA
jgi:hypothetical protein